MRLKWIYFSLFWIFFMVVGVILSQPLLAQDLAFEQRQMDALLSEAAQARQFAQSRLNQAKSYENMAEQARGNAAAARQERDKLSWLNLAKTRDDKAKDLKQQAAALIAQALAKEAEAAEIGKRIEDARKNTPPPPEITPEPEITPTEPEPEPEAEAPPAMPLDQVIGIWYKDVAQETEPFVIVSSGGDAENSSQLEAHSDNRVWTGHYDGSENPENGRVNFTYKPKPEEMNPEMPEWVRKRIEGELEWQIELNEPCGCGGGDLEGQFFPGEVEWVEGGEEDPESVKILGKGEARDFEISRQFGLTFETYGYARIAVKMPGPIDPFLTPVDGLTKLQRFNVVVDMPLEMADEAGDTIDVTITGLSSGDSITIELERAGTRGGHTVTYSHFNAATFADASHAQESDFDPQFLSLDYILGNQGARLGLEVENGEVVEFKFGEATQTVPVYNSWVQRNIARHQDVADRFRFLCGMGVSGSGTNAQKEKSTQCLSLIRNYENIMASDSIHDYIRYKIGETYFNENFGLIGRDVMVQLNRFDEPPPGLTDDRKVSKIYPNVVWVSNIERQKVTIAANAARAEYRQVAVNEIHTAITYAMYEFVAGQSGAGDVYTIFSGRDVFNKPVRGWKRVMSAVGLVSSTTLSFSLPRISSGPSLTNSLLRRGQTGGSFRYGKRAELKQQNLTQRSSGVAAGASDLPTTLSQPQVVAVGPRQITQATIFSDTPVTCGVEPRAANRSASLPTNIEPLPSQPRPLPQLDPDLTNIQSRYGAETDLVNPGADPITRPQRFETCNAGSVSPNIAKETQLNIDETNMFVWMTRNNFTTPGRSVLTAGYKTQTIQKFLEFLGAKTIMIKEGTRLRLEEMEVALQNGWYVRDVISTLDSGGGLHAVDIREIVRGADGEISHVVWYDSAYGKILRTTKCNFEQNLASLENHQLLYSWE